MFLGSRYNVKPKAEDIGLSQRFCPALAALVLSHVNLELSSEAEGHPISMGASVFIHSSEYRLEGRGHPVMLTWKMLPKGRSFACTSEGHALVIFDLNIW